MAANEIEFWFTMGSTYTYLSAMRLQEVERATGITFAWRPFNLRTILAEMKHVPFADKPRKQSYMWRDIERRAAHYGLAPRVPAPYPIVDSLLANKLAILALDEGWGRGFIRAAYRRWFEQGQEPSIEPGLSDNLREVGQDPARVLGAVSTPAMDQRITTQTDAARSLGIFGSPTFVVDGELFWGDDRVDDAIAWRRHGHLGP